MQDVILDPVTDTADDSLRKEIIARYKTASQFFSKWDDVAKEDYKFALGDQWTEEERRILKDTARPCLTFNRIRGIINIISGYQRENSARIKVNPEGGEDSTFSEVMDRLLKAVDKWSHLNYKLGYMFDDGCYCGKGWIEGLISYENDPIRGELDFKQRSPYQIKVDPDCIEYDVNKGANYLFKVVRLTKDKLIELYPEKKTLINGFYKDSDDYIENGEGAVDDTLSKSQDNDYGARVSRNWSKSSAGQDNDSGLEQDYKFTVKEYWRIKMVNKWFVISVDDGEPKRFDSEDEANQFIKAQSFGKAIKRKVKEMHVAVYCCGWVLDDSLSPFEPFYSGYPFFRFMADWAPNAENEEYRVQGITRALKDPQRDKNKVKSQSLHILNTQANSGWIGDDNALTDDGKKKLEQMGSKPGITVWKKPGTELREILPKGPNMGMIQREQEDDLEFKQISGINPDLLGMQEDTSSGRAISLRIKQAVLALVRLFTNYRYTKEILGNFVLDMVPLLFDSKKAVKVLGVDFMKKAADPQRFPEGLTEGHVQAYLQMVSDNKYDVLVTESDHNSTVRYEIFQELSQLLQTPAGSTIPLDLLVDYMDLPNSEEVKKRIAEREQQQMQMAQQQAQAQEKKPSESISFKDLPIDGQIQMAQQAGIKLDPIFLAEKLAKDELANQQRNVAIGEKNGSKDN